MSFLDNDLGDFYEGDGEQDPFGDKAYARELEKNRPATPPVDSNGAEPWTKEQYDAMQEHAHSLGYHLITPYRKGLKNIKVGVIKTAPRKANQ